MNLIINGAGGKMGKILTDMAVQNGENVDAASIEAKCREIPY